MSDIQGAAKNRPSTKFLRNGLLFKYEISHDYL